MPSLPLYNLEKKKVGSVELDDGVFGGSIHPTLLHSAVRYQVSKHYEHRTANSLTRSEVTGTGKKMYRQKGTGQARHGDEKAPIFVGGGKAHGPRPHRARRRMNKKALRGALISALSMVQKEDKLFVIDKLELDKHSTKKVAACKKAFELKKLLIVNTDEEAKEKAFNRSVRNLANAKFLRPEGVNVMDLLNYQNVLVSQKAAQKMTERLKSHA